jgi:hypothetical protein
MLHLKRLILAQHNLVAGNLSHIHNRMHSLDTIDILEGETGQKGACQVILDLEQVTKLIHQVNHVLLIFEQLAGIRAENALDVLVDQSLAKWELDVDKFLLGLVFGGLGDQLPQAQTVFVQDEEGGGRERDEHVRSVVQLPEPLALLLALHYLEVPLHVIVPQFLMHHMHLLLLLLLHHPLAALRLQSHYGLLNGHILPQTVALVAHRRQPYHIPANVVFFHMHLLWLDC